VLRFKEATVGRRETSTNFRGFRIVSLAATERLPPLSPEVTGTGLESGTATLWLPKK